LGILRITPLRLGLVQITQWDSQLQRKHDILNLMQTHKSAKAGGYLILNMVAIIHNRKEPSLATGQRG